MTMIDATMVNTGATGKRRHRLAVQALMPALVLLRMVWLLKMDATMAAVMQVRHRASSVQTLMPALVSALELV